MARILLIVMMGAFFSSAFAEDPLAGLVIEREAEAECDRVTCSADVTEALAQPGSFRTLN